MSPRRGRLRLAYSAGRRPARIPCSNPFGLNPVELRREIRRLAARGWQLWEIRRRLCPCRSSEISE